MSKQHGKPGESASSGAQHKMPEHGTDAAEVAMHHGVGDDPLVRAVKSAGGWMQENWRIAVVSVGLVILLAIVVIWNLASSADRQQRAWGRFHSATTIAKLEEMLISEAEYETVPYIHLQLIQWTDEGKDPTVTTPLDREKKLFDRIAAFIGKYGTDPQFAPQVARLQVRQTVAQENIKLLETAAKSGEASNKVPAQPQETVVVQPEFDPASGSWKPFGNPIIAFETRYGRVRFELFEDAAPNTVANIIHLVRSGFYNLDGPGGSIKRAGTATHPGMLTVGEFPAIDSATRTQNYDKLKDTNQRVKRLDRKLWESLFNVRSLNYTIPFEHSGAQRPVVAGSLVMKLALVSGDYGAPRPDSASFSFNIMAAPAPDMDLKYVVFGRVLDTPEHDSSGVLRRLGDVSDIQLAWIERIRPAMVARQIVLADGANEVVKSPEHVTRNSEGYLVPAAGSGGTSWIALYPGQAESIPTGEQYMAPAGLVQGTRFPAWGDMITPGADVTTPTVVRYHAAERAPLLARIGRMQAPMTSLGSATMLSFAALANRTSVVLLPATRPVLKDGKATAKVYTPRVQYTGWPNLVDARAAHAPPAPLNKPLELFGPRPGAPPGGGPGAMPPGGMPPGIPGLPPGMEGFPGDRGIPGIPGN